MNPKMTSVADEIGRSICKYYEEDYLDLLFSGNIVIEDVFLLEIDLDAFLLELAYGGQAVDRVTGKSAD